MDRLGGLMVIAPEHRAGDPGSNLGPGENFFSKVTILLVCNFLCFAFYIRDSISWGHSYISEQCIWSRWLWYYNQYGSSLCWGVYWPWNFFLTFFIISSSTYVFVLQRLLPWTVGSHAIACQPKFCPVLTGTRLSITWSIRWRCRETGHCKYLISLWESM